MSIFFGSNREQKEYVEQKLARFYPRFVPGGCMFERYIQEYLREGSVVLDAGCGDGGLVGKFRDIPREIIGVDLSRELLDQNKIVTRRILADLENIPLGDACVDMVVSEFVLEHLARPEKVWAEMARVLKPEGVFIFLTPNLLNPVMLISWVLPHSLHEWFRGEVLKKRELAHPTFYRANTRSRLLELASRSGFVDFEIFRAGNAEYLGFCKPLVGPAIWLEKLIDNRFLGFLKMYLVGCFIKKSVD